MNNEYISRRRRRRRNSVITLFSLFFWGGAKEIDYHWKNIKIYTYIILNKLSILHSIDSSNNNHNK